MTKLLTILGLMLNTLAAFGGQKGNICSKEFAEFKNDGLVYIYNGNLGLGLSEEDAYYCLIGASACPQRSSDPDLLERIISKEQFKLVGKNSEEAVGNTFYVSKNGSLGWSLLDNDCKEIGEIKLRRTSEPRKSECPKENSPTITISANGLIEWFNNEGSHFEHVNSYDLIGITIDEMKNNSFFLESNGSRWDVVEQVKSSCFILGQIETKK